MSRAIACRDMCIWVKGAGSSEKSVFTETGIPKKLIAPHAIPLHVVKICSSHTYLKRRENGENVKSILEQLRVNGGRSGLDRVEHHGSGGLVPHQCR